MKKKSKKRIYVLIFAAICLIFVVGGVITLRFTSSAFRYNFDVTFNCDDTHYSYISSGDGADVDKAEIALPSSTALAYRDSDLKATYYSKLSYKEFLEYYVAKGYTVKENAVQTDNGVFLITDANDQAEGDWKYNFIVIELAEE